MSAKKEKSKEKKNKFDTENIYVQYFCKTYPIHSKCEQWFSIFVFGFPFLYKNLFNTFWRPFTVLNNYVNAKQNE